MGGETSGRVAEKIRLIPRFIYCSGIITIVLSSWLEI